MRFIFWPDQWPLPHFLCHLQFLSQWPKLHCFPVPVPACLYKRYSRTWWSLYYVILNSLWYFSILIYTLFGAKYIFSGSIIQPHALKLFSNSIKCITITIFLMHPTPNWWKMNMKSIILFIKYRMPTKLSWFFHSFFTVFLFLMILICIYQWYCTYVNSIIFLIVNSIHYS